jgi:hypothetical protein
MLTNDGKNMSSTDLSVAAIDLDQAIDAIDLLGRLVRSLLLGRLAPEARGAADRLADLMIGGDSVYLDMVPAVRADKYFPILYVSDSCLELSTALRAADANLHHVHGNSSNHATPACADAVL